MAVPYTSVPLESLSLWSWRDHVAEFDVIALTVDLAIGLAAVMSLTAVIEFRRRRRGRFWQVTLREAFAISLVIAIASAWTGKSLQRTRRQQLSVENIAAAFRSGDVLFDVYWEGRGCWFFELFMERGEKPKWFGNVVGIFVFEFPDSFAVDYLADRPNRVAEEIWKALDDFPQLRILHLVGSWSLGGEFKRLQSCKQLQELTLDSGRLTDDAMKYIGSLKRLKYLGLSHNEITDEGLKHLHGLKQLGLLEIANNPITEQGVEALQRAIPGLEVWDD